MNKICSVVSVIGVLTLMGCAPSGQPTEPTPNAARSTSATRSPTADYGQQYLAAVQTQNTALAVMAAHMKTVPTTASAAEMAKLTAPAAQALRDTARALQALSWPPAVQPDIQALLTADLAMADTLDAIGAQTKTTASQWNQQLAQRSQQVAAAAAKIRTDLGLPPAGQ